MIRIKLLAMFLLGMGAVLWVSQAGTADARMMHKEGEEKVTIQSAKLAAGLPNAQQRVHRVGLMRLCVTNWGFFGSQTRELNESMEGCFNPNPDKLVAAPSCEYPAGSDLEYLFQGGLADLDQNGIVEHCHCGAAGAVILPQKCVLPETLACG